MARLRCGTVQASVGVNILANQVGKRYQCSKCNTEMIVTKAGDGEIACCSQPMEQKK